MFSLSRSTPTWPECKNNVVAVLVTEKEDGKNNSFLVKTISVQLGVYQTKTRTIGVSICYLK